MVLFNKIRKKERERTRSRSRFYDSNLPYISLLFCSISIDLLVCNVCNIVLFFFISFVAFWLILFFVFFFFLLWSFVLFVVDNHLKEMPHRIRKIVSKCRPPFAAIHRKRYTHAASTHQCMCQSTVFFNLIFFSIQIEI